MADAARADGDAAPPKGTPINITFRDQNGNEVNFKLKTTTPLTKAIDAYAGQQGVAADTLRFFFDDRRIVPGDTPGALEMEEGDMIDVHQHQIGGSEVGLEAAENEDNGEEEARKGELPLHLKLRVVDQHDGELEFNLKYTTLLEKLMRAYCKTKEVSENSIKFLFEGERLNKTDTAKGKGMTDNDIIQAFLEQQGGDGEAGGDANGEGAEAAEKKHLEIVVKDQNNNETTFKIKATTKLGQVKDAYCDRNGKGPKSIRFTFDGDIIQPGDTPESLEMVNKDVIDVFTEQLGGQCRA